MKLTEKNQDNSSMEEKTFNLIERIVVLITGLSIIAIGIVWLYQLISIAWDFFEMPSSIDQYANALQAGSHLTDGVDTAVFKLVAWLLLLLIFLVIGRLLVWMIEAGIKIIK